MRCVAEAIEDEEEEEEEEEEEGEQPGPAAEQRGQWQRQQDGEAGTAAGPPVAASAAQAAGSGEQGSADAADAAAAGAAAGHPSSGRSAREALVLVPVEALERRQQAPHAGRRRRRRGPASVHLTLVAKLLWGCAHLGYTPPQELLAPIMDCVQWALSHDRGRATVGGAGSAGARARLPGGSLLVGKVGLSTAAALYTALQLSAQHARCGLKQLLWPAPNPSCRCVLTTRPAPPRRSAGAARQGAGAPALGAGCDGGVWDAPLPQPRLPRLAPAGGRAAG